MVIYKIHKTLDLNLPDLDRWDFLFREETLLDLCSEHSDLRFCLQMALNPAVPMSLSCRCWNHKLPLVGVPFLGAVIDVFWPFFHQDDSQNFI